MTLRLGQWVNMVRIFFDHWIGKFYRKYLVWDVKMDVVGGAKLLKYIRFMMKMVLGNLLSLVDLDGLDM
jgi:hypothetical protein